MAARCERSRPVFRFAFVVAVVAAALWAQPAAALEKVIFGTDWFAQAEHGGFYQAKATGLYASHGLEVEIRQGGPQVNHPQLLAAGRVDIILATNTAIAINFAANDIPMVTVAAIFQKDPQILMAHAGAGIGSIAAMKGRPVMLSAAPRQTWWPFLKQRFGFTDDMIRPYTFQMAPFLTDPDAIQQGYVTSEPFLAARAGASPDVFLLADIGWPSYAAMLTASKALVDENRDLVQRFVDASIEGWYSYLYGDPAPGNALIKAANPDMPDDVIANAIAGMRAFGIVDSGDALTRGIGAMDAARLQGFFTIMADAGIYPRDLDFMRAFDLGFVNAGVGLARKAALGGE